MLIFQHHKECLVALLRIINLHSEALFTLHAINCAWRESALAEILVLFTTNKGYDIEDSAKERILDITEYFRSQPNFANARTIRNILDQVIMNQNLRTEDEDNNSIIILDDVEDYITDEKITFVSSPKRKIGF